MGSKSTALIIILTVFLISPVFSASDTQDDCNAIENNNQTMFESLDCVVKNKMGSGSSLDLMEDNRVKILLGLASILVLAQLARWYGKKFNENS